MKTMNIVIASSNELAIYVPALQASLYENHKGIDVHIFLMHSHIEPERVETLKAFAESYNQVMVEIKVNDDDFEFFGKIAPDKIARYTLTTFYSLLAPQYLPLDVERCLYIDVDIICADNIYDWYCSDFNGMFFVTNQRYKDKMFYFFNCGFYLINVKKHRDEGIDRKFYMQKCDEVVENNIKGLLADQGLLAYSFKDFENNGFTVAEDEGINYRPCWKKNVALGLEEPPAIKLIHYNSGFKAWNCIFDNSMANVYIGEHSNTSYNFSVLTSTVISLYSLFWKYAEKTPFYDEIYNKALMATNELKKNAKYFGEAKKADLMLQAISLRDDDESGRLLIPKAAFNEYGTAISETDAYTEYRTQYFISDQWIVFPLCRKLKKGERFSLNINCEYKAGRSLKLFLSDVNRKRQELPPISAPEYSCKETINADGYRFLCLWSNSFRMVGDYIRIFEMNASVNGEGSISQGHRSNTAEAVTGNADSIDNAMLQDKIMTQAAVIEELKDIIVKICTGKSDRNEK